MKLAAIYVRTSSEHQGEGASPEEQERDCRRLAEERGLEVVAVYRDVTRYRVKKRMVDPSGTRADRPGLVAMLNDARAGKFDTILAWREDRLYRGMRAMLNVLDVVQEEKLDVLLARETFDAKMAPLKAWVAQMELDGMKERMTMGAKARLRSGKATTGQDRYGYRRKDGEIVIVEKEARWVRQIFDWYIQRAPMMEIRQRLIAAGAPQKGSSVPRKVEWSRSVIQAILGAAEEYARGIKRHTRAGEVYEMQVPPIISMDTYRQFLKVREANKTYPSRHVKRDYLAGGLIHCACGRKWGARTHQRIKSKKTGHVVATGVYYCQQPHKEHRHPDCPRTIGSKKADRIVWKKVQAVLKDPEILLASARQQVDDQRRDAAERESERQRIRGQLEALQLERQDVIRMARKRLITEEDMTRQLAELAMQEPYLRGELASIEVAEGLIFSDNWEDAVRARLQELRAGLSAVNVKNDFAFKRRIVEALVERVYINRDREMTVYFRLDLLDLLGAYLEENLEGRNL